jgi:hypothetical protein
VDPGHRGLLSIELGYAKETVSLLLSKLANPEAKTGTIEIPVTYSRIGQGTGAAKNPFLAQLENEAGPGYGTKRRGGARDKSAPRLVDSKRTEQLICNQQVIGSNPIAGSR